MNLSFSSKFDAPTLENVIHSETFGTIIEKVTHSTTRRSLFHNDLNEANINRSQYYEVDRNYRLSGYKS